MSNRSRLSRKTGQKTPLEGIKRGYSAEDVVNLRGSLQPAHTLAQRGADKLWELIHGGAKKGYVNCLGALTGGQAVQQAKAGIEAIYLSGWQVAADNNLSSTMYPDQSLYPANSVPSVVERINNSFARADQIQWANKVGPEDKGFIDYFLPIVADAEAGFGGVLNAFELMKGMIEAGAAGVHFEDQLASVKSAAIWAARCWSRPRKRCKSFIAARLAADVCGTTTLVIARTDANAADLLTTDADPYDAGFLTGERTSEGFYKVQAGIEQAISRGLAYAPYADMVWCETAKPDLDEARKFAEAIKAQYPDKILAYNCSPSFNWKKNLDDATIARFQQGALRHGLQVPVHHPGGYPQHVVPHVRAGLYQYARGEGMKHYVEMVQQPEFAAAERGYTFVAHQQEVGTGYFDKVTTVIQGGQSSVTALTGSTEEDQFH